MRARPDQRGPPILEEHQPSADARTDPPSLEPPQPPVEAIGRALPNTSTCVELANLIDSASESPAVTENPAQIDTLPRADYCPSLQRQHPTSEAK
jgi:hypothetical protein